MKDWARKEVEIACKRENPDWDGESFDYGCACYQSALKAYESLCDDLHSGFSFSITKHILIRLMDGQLLTPITDEDFFTGKDDEFYSSDYLKEKGLKSKLQCPRMSSLFREETLDGKVKYHDNDRSCCINVENPRFQYTGWLCNVVDELFPITMPYSPKREKYKIYVYEFLCDAANGDFDHRGIQRIVTPEGKEIKVDDWFFREENHKMVKISEEEFFEDMEHRIDSPENAQ